MNISIYIPSHQILILNNYYTKMSSNNFFTSIIRRYDSGNRTDSPNTIFNIILFAHTNVNVYLHNIIRMYISIETSSVCSFTIHLSSVCCINIYVDLTQVLSYVYIRIKNGIKPFETVSLYKSSLCTITTMTFIISVRHQPYQIRSCLLFCELFLYKMHFL